MPNRASGRPSVPLVLPGNNSGVSMSSQALYRIQSYSPASKPATVISVQKTEKSPDLDPQEHRTDASPTPLASYAESNVEPEPEAYPYTSFQVSTSLAHGLLHGAILIAASVAVVLLALEESISVGPIICCGVICYLAILGIAGDVVTHRSWRQVISNLLAVAELDMGLPEPLRVSNCAEIQTVEHLTFLLRKHILEFEPYLPSNVFNLRNGDAAEETPESHDPQDHRLRLPLTARTDGSHTIVTPRSADTRSVVSARSTSSKGTRESKDPQSLSHKTFPKRVVWPVQSRTVSMVLIDWQNFETLLNTLPLSDVVDIHGSAMDNILSVVKASGSSADRFTGDKVALFWNIGGKSMSQLQAAQKSLDAALSIQASLQALARSYPQYEHDIVLRYTVVQGVCAAGAWGGKTLKSNTAIGSLVSFGYNLNKFQRKYPGDVICDYSICTSAGGSFAAYAVDRVRGTMGASTKLMTLFRVMDSGNMEENRKEWMYEVASNDQLSKFTEFNDGYQAVCNGRYHSGLGIMLPFISEDMDEGIEDSIRRLIALVYHTNGMEDPKEPDLAQAVSQLPASGPAVVATSHITNKGWMTTGGGLTGGTSTSELE